MAGQGQHAAVKGQTRACVYCGEQFPVYQAHQKYCSLKHRVYAAQERRVLRAFQESLGRHRVLTGRGGAD